MGDQTDGTRAPRTRRTILTGAAAAAVASVLASQRTEAAAGDPILQGQTNTVGPFRTALASTASTTTLHVSNTVGRALVATTQSRDAFGLFAANTAGRHRGEGAAVRAEGRQVDAIQGETFGVNRAGVVGINRKANDRAVGVVGVASQGVGVLGIATRRRLGWAVYAAGDVAIEGNLFINGRILQPAAASGTTQLTGSGTARVRVPAEERGASYDYQLTAIGAAMPNLHVVERADGGFTIRGGQPGGRVSWQRIKRTDAAALGALASTRHPDLSGYLER
jgi:hypothetical protein